MPIAAISASSIMRTTPASTMGENAGTIVCAAASMAAGDNSRCRCRTGGIADAAAPEAALICLTSYSLMTDASLHRPRGVLALLRRSLAQKFQERLSAEVSSNRTLLDCGAVCSEHAIHHGLGAELG